tara:strand:- start:10867 stop:11625 length:759 start_codon:yes stop_codon:yes gene_type:complete
MSFKDKLVIVTGAGSGIGQQITKDLISSGAVVAALGRNIDKLKSIETNKTQNLHSFECDISIEENVESTFKEVHEKISVPYGLVNCAGINPSRNAISETESKHWDETIAVNLTGTFNCIKHIIGFLKSKNEGSIVNISSIAGISALEKRSAYTASKAGVIGLTKSTAIDYSQFNIRVNCVCPGYVETPLVSNYLEGLKPDEEESLVKSHLLGRLGSVNDISNAVNFLLSPESSWITGAIVPVDGGFTLGKRL